MKTIIFRKTDLLVVGMIPEVGTFDSELKLNVLPNFGGKKEDYATLDVPYDYFKLEIKDGVVVAVEVAAPPLPPEPANPPTMEDLKRENEMLQASVMELSTIVATQEASQKILEQSVLELSTLLTTT